MLIIYNFKNGYQIFGIRFFCDRFLFLMLQTISVAANGMYKNAIATAKKSLELSKKAGNDDYMKINSDNIAKWSKK